MNYTKGPWEIEGSNVLANDRTVAIVFDPDSCHCTEVSKANTRLIAAAPVMYKAGKDALVSLKLWANQHPDDEVLAMVITELEYALAQAEGKY